jgi:hypothetical protein
MVFFLFFSFFFPLFFLWLRENLTSQEIPCACMPHVYGACKLVLRVVQWGMFILQISQGAEAKVWSTTFLGRKTIIKQRFHKTYRHPTLDALLTKQRLKAEVRCMIRARKLGVFTPVPYHTEVPAASIYMESIEGVVAKEVPSHFICL